MKYLEPKFLIGFGKKYREEFGRIFSTKEDEMMIALSVQSVQHIVDLLKEDWPVGGGEPMNEGEKMIRFLEDKIDEKSSL